MTKKEVVLQHREMKKAKQKLAVADAFIKELETSKFEDVIIKEVCVAAEISEGTFYNYFPKKSDVIFYYREISFVKIIAHLKGLGSRYSALQRINTIFDVLAEGVSNANVLYELSSLFIRNYERRQKRTLTPAEVCYIAPEVSYDDIIAAESLHGVFCGLLRDAKKNEELPPRASVDDAALSLNVIMAGVPMSIEEGRFAMLKKYYQKQLKLLWKALKK